jgi:hypothetical protein
MSIEKASIAIISTIKAADKTTMAPRLETMSRDLCPTPEPIVFLHFVIAISLLIGSKGALFQFPGQGLKAACTGEIRQSRSER